MAKKIILIFLGLVVLIIGGLSLYISYIDWNAYKKEIAEKISEITGKKIEFSGKLSVSLLPQPTLKASEINIYNPNSPEQKLASIAEMSTRVSLPSLLSGTPDVRSMALVGAEIWLDINDKDEFNWRSYNAVSGFGGIESNIRLQSLSIQNSLIHINNENLGIKFDIQQANADVWADSLMGPYRLDGNFMKDNDHFGVAVSVGNFAMLTDVNLNFAITHPKSESFLRFDGVYQMNENYIKGDFSGGSQKTADFINIISGTKLLQEEHNIPLQFSLGVNSDDKNVNLSSFVIKYGNLIEGAGSMIIPLQTEEGKARTAELKYQLVNLDIRPIVSLLKAEYEIFKSNGNIYNPNSNIDIIADISADRVVLNETPFGYLENMGIKGSWKNNALTIDEFRALGAGETLINLSGSLISENKAPQYFIRSTLNGKDFLTFLTSIGINATLATQSTYKNVNLSFNLGGNNNAVSINDIKFSMDKMEITSVIGITFKENGTIYDIQIDADSINLDNYWPKKEDAGSAIANLHNYLDSISFLKWHNINCRFKAKQLIFRGVNFEKPIIVFGSADGLLDVKTLSAEKALDSSFLVSGKVSNLGTVDVAFNDMNFEIDSSSISDVVKKLQIPVPDWKIFSAKSMKAKGEYSGSLQSGVVKFDATADELRFNYQGSISQTENFGFDGNVSLKTINFNEFFNNVGGSLNVSGNTRGALNCNGNIKGTPKNWQFNDANCVLGIAKYTGNISVENKNSLSKITGTINVDDFNVENFINIQTQKGGSASLMQRGNDFLARPDFSKDVFDFNIYRNLIMDINLTAERGLYKSEVFNNINLHILNSENIMQLDNISFKQEDRSTKGSIQINYMQEPVVKGVLNIDNIKIKDFGGATYGIADGLANIKAEFGMTASSVDEFVNNYSGSIDFEVKNIKIKGFDINKIITDLSERTKSKGVFQQVRNSLQSGETSFDSLKGRFISSAGNMKFENTSMENSEVSSKINGNIGLADWRMDSEFIFDMKKTTEIPQFSCNLSGMINKPVLDINVAEVAKKYDAYWEKIEADEQAKKVAKEKELADKMTEAQKNVSLLSDEVNLIAPMIDDYKSLSNIQPTVEWYNKQLTRISEINKDIDEMQGKAHIPGYTEAEITIIMEKTAQHMKEIDTISANVEDKYEKDITERKSNLKNNFSETYTKSNNFMKEYKDMIINREQDIQRLGYKESIQQNVQIKSLQDKMNEISRQVEELNNIFNSGILAVENIKDIDVLEESIKQLSEKYKELQNLVSKEDEFFANTVEILDDIYKKQYDIYQKEQQIKEIRRKEIEAENANNLLYEKNEVSNDVKIVTSPEADYLAQSVNIEMSNSVKEEGKEVEKTQYLSTEASAKGDKVDNFNDKTEKAKPILRKYRETEYNSNVETSGTIKKSYEEETKKEIKKKGILRPSEGAVSKVSGTIVVK